MGALFILVGLFSKDIKGGSTVDMKDLSHDLKQAR